MLSATTTNFATPYSGPNSICAPEQHLRVSQRRRMRLAHPAGTYQTNTDIFHYLVPPQQKVFYPIALWEKENAKNRIALCLSRLSGDSITLDFLFVIASDDHVLYKNFFDKLKMLPFWMTAFL
nr:hypothetical protein [uncultured Agathobaculum sp.]